MWGARAYFILQLNTALLEGNPGRKLKPGTEAETMEEHCSLTCLTWLARPPFLYNPGHQPSPPGAGPLLSVIN